MTEDVSWAAPSPGPWLRNFRLGEWLADPITPLFESWALERVETTCFKGMVADGFPTHITVNGWYYHSPLGARGVRRVLRMARRPVKLLLTFGLVRWRPDLTQRWIVEPAARRWADDLLPRYQRVVRHGEAALGTLTARELVELIDTVAVLAGEYFASMTQVAGFAWKAEWALARFYRRHLTSRVGGTHQSLLASLDSAPNEPAAHDVVTLDWVQPPGCAPRLSPRSDAVTRRLARGASERTTLEARCRAALALEVRLLRSFDRLMMTARTSAQRRDDQSHHFTLGWPLLHRAVTRLGARAVTATAVDSPSDVFFLTRGELEAVLDGQPADLRTIVAERRGRWTDQRRLRPPLRLGVPAATERIAATWRAVHDDHPASNRLTGQAASPGQSTGPARIVRGPEDFDKLAGGDVLVAPLTTPGWTPLFADAAAIITESGTVLAHAAVVAREYGLPGVVAVPDATHLIRDDEVVTVDGTDGTIILHRDP